MSRLPPRLRRWWPYAKVAYTGFTRAVSPASMRLARLTDHGGPTGIVGTAEDAVRRSGGSVWVVREPEELRRPMPHGVPALQRAFVAAMSDRVPRVAVAELPGARVDGRTGAVVTASNDLVDEFSSYFGNDRPSEHPLFLRPFRSAPFEHDGVLGVLATRGDVNYYHFLFDVLPRLAILRDCPDAPSASAYYVRSETRFHRELLDRFGIAAGALVNSRDHPYVRASRLLVPGLPDRRLQMPAWVPAWLREQLLTEPPEPKRRIYVTRGSGPGVRAVSNEAAVLARLEPLGFECIDPGTMSVADQIAAFASAETIVAPHGAALSNLVFAPAGAAVVELFAPDYVNTCYWALAWQLEAIDYRYLLGAGSSGRDDQRGVASEIVVDLDELLDLLER